MVRPSNWAQNEDSTESFTRRNVLGTFGGGLIIGSHLGSATTDIREEILAEHSVEQGGDCFSITPLEGDVPVEELYDLRIPAKHSGDNGATDPGTGPYYESIGTRDLQRPNTTITFLYSGPSGLSLVIVHDSENGDGGAVSWTVSGIPPGSRWVVKDDYYLDPETGEPVDSNYDRWDVDGWTHTIDWTWGNSKTDGGVLGGLGENFEIQIDPSFNDEASFWNQYYRGEITDWQILSGSDEDLDRFSLALDQSVTIQTGGCLSLGDLGINIVQRLLNNS